MVRKPVDRNAYVDDGYMRVRATIQRSFAQRHPWIATSMLILGFLIAARCLELI